MNWMILPLKRYADFQGRSRRTEYWMFVLFMLICYVVLGLVAGLLGGFSGTTASTTSSAAVAATGFGFLTGPMLVLLGLFALAMFIPSLAVQVRRFHDQDKSGWFVLLGLIPYAGGLIILVFMCLEGTKGTNRFGADPKNPEGDLTSVFR